MGIINHVCDYVYENEFTAGKCKFCGRLKPDPTLEIFNKPTKSLPPKNNDPVNKPSHYTFGKYEVIDVINDWKLAFNLGNVIKYVCRAGKKDLDKHIQDLEKARFYLDYEIKKLKEIK